ncbi:MAG: prolyl oligopeptidase family serine peptidase [Planctomycetota bacterium]
MLRLHPACVYLALTFSGITTSANAQVDRYELGLRLRAFEQRLAATEDTARRDAAFVALDRGVQAFFRLDPSAVAAALTDAEAALAATPADDVQRALASLFVAPRARLLPVRSELAFDLRRSWSSETELPGDLVLALAVDDAPFVRSEVDAVPGRGSLPLGDLAEGDHELRSRLCAGERVVWERRCGISVVAHRDERLAALQVAAGTAGDDLDGLTLVSTVRLLTAMTRPRGEETVLPGARLLAEAEQLAKAIADGAPFHGPAHPGQHWLRVPTGRGACAVRLLVPPATEAPKPLVLALHGAGGSENLFFDSYGAGEAVRRCEKRGLYLCAPRQGFGVPDLPALVDALATRYPIDRSRVLLIGHSMGAAMAIANAGRAPARFAAVAALGGGGEPGDGDVSRLPFFVAAGSRDFLRASAEGLRDRLRAVGAPVTWRTYAGVEHWAIVQLALPGVFAWWDELDRR